MNVPAPQVVADSTLRRFELPDIDRHGLWILPRLRDTYKHLSDRQIIGWLRSMIYSQEFLFLYQEYSVACFQVMSAHTLQPNPVVYERFVFVSDKDSQEQLAQASMFYSEAEKWAKHQRADALIVNQKTDVPVELIRERLKRLNERTEVFLRIRVE